MSKKIILENSIGNRIIFSYENDTPFFIKSITGIHEMIGNVSTTKNAWSVGEKYNGTSISKRNIVINIEMFDNFVNNRLLLYKMLPLKEIGKLYYYEDDISRKIEYYVESVSISDSGIPRTAQISLICNNPYFTDIEENVVNIFNWEPKLEFPISINNEEKMEFARKNSNILAIIENDTNIEIGMHIKFTFKDEVVNPGLLNINSQETLMLNGLFSSNDIVEITTFINNKNIVLLQDDQKKNINNLLKFGTKYLQVHPGTNTFKSISDSGTSNFITEISYVKNYEAI